jgi:hypothetical protein
LPFQHGGNVQSLARSFGNVGAGGSTAIMSMAVIFGKSYLFLA